MRHFGGLRRAGAVAEEPRDVACLRYRRAGAFRGREADPAAQDPVALLRPFGRAACDRGAADRLFQQRPPARGLPAGFAGRIGRPGAAGAHEPAAAGAGRSGIQGGCAPGCRRALRAGVAADRAPVQGGVGAAQRHAVHERLRRLGFDPVPPPERVGRPHRGAVARRFRRAHRAFLRRGAPDPRPPRTARHGTEHPAPVGRQPAGRTPQETRTGSLFVPLHPPGARGFEGHHRLCRERTDDRDQQHHRQPDGLPRRGHGRLGGEFRPAYRAGDGFPRHSPRRAGQHLRAAHL